MLMNKKKIDKLLKERNIKYKAIRLLKKKEHVDKLIEYRELNLKIGTIWTMQDRKIPFDNKRAEKDYKNSGRPVLVLETPNDFSDYSLVSLAPGTSIPHVSSKTQPVFDILSTKKNNPITTYFLLYFKWKSVQKNLNKIVSTLNSNQLNSLIKLLNQD